MDEAGCSKYKHDFTYEAFRTVDQSLLGLTAEIVSGYVSNNRTPADQLSGLIQAVYQSFATAGSAAAAFTAVKVQPAVDPKKSVFSTHLVCLVCGQRFKMLKRHLGVEHNLTPKHYRDQYGLAASYPIVAPDYAKVRSALAKKIGLGRDGSSRLPTRRMGAKRGR
jgi:predicted transcriptional regulator